MNIAKKHHLIVIEDAAQAIESFYTFSNGEKKTLESIGDWEDRTKIIKKLKDNEILGAFHYLSLHKSEYYQNKYDGRSLKNSVHFEDCLLRLPFFYELKGENIDTILKILHETTFN